MTIWAIRVGVYRPDVVKEEKGRTAVGFALYLIGSSDR